MPDRPHFNQFNFKDYQFDKETKTLTFHYSFDDTVNFEHKLIFNFPLALPDNQELLDRVFFGLFVISGISYYKADVFAKIEFPNHKISPSQRDFFQTVYDNGLGQLFYENKIDPTGVVNLPTANSPELEPISYQGNGNLIALGGGKDSLVTIDAMQKNQQDFATWHVENRKPGAPATDLSQHRFGPLVQKIGAQHLIIDQYFDPQLTKLNEQGALNGHVPISAIWSFIGIATAVLSGRDKVLVSNENSANVGNVEYHGRQINHQYSKSIEYEKLFQAYLHQNISADLDYFSFLRPLTELKIAELFAENLFDQYKGIFSSCNRNFRMVNDKQEFFWCGECSKCAFIFAAFSPFVEKQKLLDLFGKNMYADPAMHDTFEELMGRHGHKPFECVGEIEETRLAMLKAWQTGNWPELNEFNLEEYKENPEKGLNLVEPGSPEKPSFNPETEKDNYNYEKLSTHSMPAEYYQILTNYLGK